MSVQDLNTRLQQALASGRPAEVSRVVTRAGADSTGDPAVWIWIILDDTSPAADKDGARRTEIRRWAEQAAAAVLGSSWAYVSFRTEAEQRELERV